MYYYLALSLLLVSFGVTIFWQLQEDTAVFDYKESHIVTSPSQRGFFTEISFCVKQPSNLIVQSNFFSMRQNNYYVIPNSQFLTDKNNCLKTKVFAYVGQLDKGFYEYSIEVTYDVNPLRKSTKTISRVYLEVK